jgi:catechol 2,3-dioxygenase-like lactoylglutathione lyase family enzyme
MDRPHHAGLRHLALNVRDMAAMKRFYVDLLGFAIEWEPDADNVYLSSGIDNLALHRAAPAAGGADPPPGRSALDHLGLIVRTPDEVDRWAAFLESEGVAIGARPRTHRDGARSCYFRDPDGNSVQIIHHPPISDKV